MSAGRAESVHLAAFPTVDDDLLDPELAERWARIVEVRDWVLVSLEQARQSGRIGKPLESRVIIEAPGELYEFLEPYADMLASVFIVSQVELVRSSGAGLAVTVEPPIGRKCARCWLVLESVGTHADRPDLCDRCREVVG